MSSASAFLKDTFSSLWHHFHLSCSVPSRSHQTLSCIYSYRFPKNQCIGSYVNSLLGICGLLYDLLLHQQTILLRMVMQNFSLKFCKKKSFVDTYGCGEGQFSKAVQLVFIQHVLCAKYCKWQESRCVQPTPHIVFWQHGFHYIFKLTQAAQFTELWLISM